MVGSGTYRGIEVATGLKPLVMTGAAGAYYIPVTGDYFEGSGYNWVNFQGENPKYPESMREISSYELKQMGS